jgi:hypothetical protein
MIAPLRWPLACYPYSIEIYEDSTTCWFLPAVADIAAKIRLSIAVAGHRCITPSSETRAISSLG